MIDTSRNWSKLLPLDREDRAPLQQQIYRRIRDAIAQGLLRPGERLASWRSLASELGVARGTIEAAYGQLAGEGYILARGQAGTCVAPSLRVPRQQPAALPRPRHDQPQGGVAASVQAVPPPPAAPPPLQLGIPALDAFPRKLWARLGSRALRSMQAADMFYGDPAGHPRLRQALAAYLSVSRGVACAPGQVFVTAGQRASLALVAHTLLAPGDQVWMEDPGHPPTRELIVTTRCRPVAVPVDEQGLMVALGLRRAPAARLAVVTPSHQAPLGVALSMARRIALLDWARSRRAWVVEDDYDGEFHYDGRPLPSLQSLDRHQRVIYFGSFSKTLHPGLALSYLVVPEAQASTFAAAAAAWSNGCSPLTQAIAADFLTQGHFARHLKKMRLLYARRRAWLAQALAQAFGDRVRVELARGGMHLIARFDGAASDVLLAAQAQAVGLNCQALSLRSARPSSAAQGLLMGFTNVASAAEADRLARRLRELWRI